MIQSTTHFLLPIMIEKETDIQYQKSDSELHFTHYFKKSTCIINTLEDIEQARLDNLERKKHSVNDLNTDSGEIIHDNNKDNGNLCVTTENTQLILDASQGSEQALYILENKLKQASDALIQTNKTYDTPKQIHEDKNLNLLIKQLSEEQHIFERNNKYVQFCFGGFVCLIFLGIPALADLLRLIHSNRLDVFLPMLVPMLFAAWSIFSIGSTFEKCNKIIEFKIKSLKEQIISDGKDTILLNEKILQLAQNVNKNVQLDDWQKESDISLNDTHFTEIENPEIIYDLIAQHGVFNIHHFQADDIKAYFQIQKQITRLTDSIDFNCTAGALSFIFLTWLGMMACDFFTSFNFFNVYHFIGLTGVSIFSTLIIRKLFIKKYRPLQILNEKLNEAKAGLQKLKQYFSKPSVKKSEHQGYNSERATH